MIRPCARLFIYKQSHERTLLPCFTAQTCQVSGLKGTQVEGQAGIPEPMFLSIESSKIKCTVIYYLFLFVIIKTLVFQSRFELSLEKDGRKT